MTQAFGTDQSASDQDSDESVHPHILARAFAIRVHIIWNNPASTHRRAINNPTAIRHFNCVLAGKLGALTKIETSMSTL